MHKIKKSAAGENIINRRDAIKRGLSVSVLGGVAASLSTGLSTPAIAQSAINWRMVTSWPKNLPGPGVSAQRIVDRINLLSGGRLTIKLFSAGELVPAFGVFDAVSSATAQIGHSAPLFWSGKFPTSPLFTAGPYGLTPLEHITWINAGGGQALWDELYASSNIKPLMAGNTGYQMGGWFKKELTGLDDLKGLKIRMPGLGGAVLSKLGAVQVGLPPSEIFTSLSTGVIDATEFLGPYSDAAMGFFRVAKNYYSPGFHEPNGTGEALISLDAWNELPDDLRAIVESACAEENIRSLAEAEWNNAAALEKLTTELGVTVRSYPQSILDATREATVEVMAELSSKDDLSRRIVESYQGAAKHLAPWSNVSVKAFLSARS